MYIIPKNVRSRFQFFEGFGWFELFLVLLGTAIGFILSMIIFLITKSPLSFLFIVAGGAFGFFLGVSDPRTNQNVIDIFRASRSFHSRPKRYYYRFGDGRCFHD